MYGIDGSAYTLPGQQRHDGDFAMPSGFRIHSVTGVGNWQYWIRATKEGEAPEFRGGWFVIDRRRLRLVHSNGKPIREEDTIGMFPGNPTLVATDTEKLSVLCCISGASLSCAAFLDYSTETPQAAVPAVSQLMWTHIEEPAPSENILFHNRLCFLTQLRDSSGNVTVGLSQRCALELANAPDQQTFIEKHAAGELNFPLLCHARVCRTIRGLPEDRQYVNHQLEKLEPVSWDPVSAPNATYTDVLSILNNCPPNEDGIVFACLEDLHPDPFSGMRTSYDGSPGPKGVFAAVLVASNRKSDRNPISENGYKVVTVGVKDMANPAGNATAPVGDHTLVGYCTLADLPSFTLDPPRGKEFRVALALINKVDAEGFHVHKTENIEPDQVANAIQCMQRLRRMSKQIHPTCSEKRSHNLSLTTSGLKKARTLQSVPTGGSLPDVTNQKS